MGSSPPTVSSAGQVTGSEKAGNSRWPAFHRRETREGQAKINFGIATDAGKLSFVEETGQTTDHIARYISGFPVNRWIAAGMRRRAVVEAALATAWLMRGDQRRSPRIFGDHESLSSLVTDADQRPRSSDPADGANAERAEQGGGRGACRHRDPRRERPDDIQRGGPRGPPRWRCSPHRYHHRGQAAEAAHPRRGCEAGGRHWVTLRQRQPQREGPRLLSLKTFEGGPVGRYSEQP